MVMMRNFDEVINHLGARQKRKVAVVWPLDEHTVEAVDEALRLDIADFVLIGSKSPAVNALQGRYGARVDVVETPDADAAVREAVAMVRRGEADVLMKGLVNTENLLKAVLDKNEGILAPGCVLSHVTCAEIPMMNRLLFFSDAAVIPFPSAEQLVAMTGYAADVCRAFGVERPAIALIHCNEKTNPKFPVTTAYTLIKEKASEGCFGDVCVDGPMDVKTALDAHSAQIKGIKSAVSGRADALIFPDIEAANVFYKAISFFANSVNGGMLLGASAPVVLPSRSDSSRSKLCSIASACVYASSKLEKTK